jgi:hypothetical protein
VSLHRFIINNSAQVSPPGPVPVSGPGLRLVPNDTTPDRGFSGGPTNGTTPDRGFWEEDTNGTTPDRVFLGDFGLRTKFFFLKKHF